MTPLDRLVEIEELLERRTTLSIYEFYEGAVPAIQYLIGEIYRLRAHIAVLEDGARKTAPEMKRPTEDQT